MIGIVAEFNPYHQGHRYLIEQARLHFGDEPIVVCMSGDFVQRGEPAIVNKFERSASTDADLILELPLPWCLSSAEIFARGAVGLLKSFGCNKLCFGSECGNVDELRIDISTEDVIEYQKSHPNLSFPAARSALLGNDILNYPNNLLGFEYLKFAENMDVFTVKRNTVHDGVNSAKFLRQSMNKPDLDREIISRLKMYDKDFYNTIQDSDDGIGTRLFNAVGKSSELGEIYILAKTKRITESHIRRLTMCTALGIRKGLNDGIPSYARVLFANKKGRSALKEKHEINVITKPAEINTLDLKSREVFAIGAYAHDFYNLGFTESRNINRGEDYRKGPVIV